MRFLTSMLMVGLAAGALQGAPIDPEQFTPAALRERVERQAPRQGVPAIREKMRELKVIRNRLLELSRGSRFALGGNIELLLYDTNELLESVLDSILRYRVLVEEMRVIPVTEYLKDPGTQWALERAIGFGEHTALAIPRIHRLGYLRIQPILDGPLNLQRPRIFGDRPPVGAVLTKW